jgi:subtilisin family serine protease
MQFAIRLLTVALGLTASVSLGAGDLMKRVVIVDTGLDMTDKRFRKHLCAEGHKDFTGEGLVDRHGHGTHVAGLIIRNAGSARFCLIIVKYYVENAKEIESLRRSNDAVTYAASLRPDLVNYSGGGGSISTPEYDAINSSHLTKWVVAAGNEGANMDYPANRYYPACYGLDNVVVVGSLTKEGTKSRSSNFGNDVAVWEVGENQLSDLPGKRTGYMTGTSQATAVVTGKILAGSKLRTELPESPACEDALSCPLRIPVVPFQ